MVWWWLASALAAGTGNPVPEGAQVAPPARVVVLAWPETDTGYTHARLRRAVTKRIAHPDARFYPSEDLYQKGRVHPDPSMGAADQPAVVPDEAIDRVLDAVAVYPR